MDVGRVLVEARRRAGLTQRELSRRTGVPQPSIARIESGRTTPRVDTLDRLLRGCGEVLTAVERLSDGVDVTLFRTVLRGSPRDRLVLAEGVARDFHAMRIAVRPARVAEGVPTDRVAALEVLNRHGVEFIIVGGVAGNLLGSPIATFDVDVCYRRSRENHVRLVSALKELRAVPRGAEQHPFVLNEQTIRNGMTFTFDTTAGPLDCLGELAGAGGYEQLVVNAETFYLAGGTVRVCSLSDLIRMKRAAGRRKDILALPTLEALQETLDDDR